MSATGDQRNPDQPGRRFWHILPLIAILGWRLAFPPLAGLSRDWILVVSVCLILCVFTTGSRSRSILVLATMAFLLGVYVHGQLGYVLATLGWNP